jgi:hypothetical protein
LLLGPLAVVATVVYYRLLLGWFPDSTADQQAWLREWYVLFEKLGPALLAVVLAIYWFKAIYTRNLTYVILTVLVGCLLLRELHWRPETDDAISIKDAIYPLLIICLTWLALWRDIIDRPTANWSQTVFLIAALLTYGLCQFIEKGLIGKRIPIIPDFATIHSQVEEIVECCAHSLLLLAAIFGSWRRRRIEVHTKN